jgi:hypothetical protein
MTDEKHEKALDLTERALEKLDAGDEIRGRFTGEGALNRSDSTSRDPRVAASVSSGDRRGLRTRLVDHEQHRDE